MLQHGRPTTADGAVLDRFLVELIETQLLEFILWTVPSRSDKTVTFGIAEAEKSIARDDRWYALKLTVGVAGPDMCALIDDFITFFDHIIATFESENLAHSE